MAMKRKPTYRAAAPHILAHNEVLVRDIRQAAALAEDGTRRAAGGVLLLTVYLDDRALVQLRLVLGVMVVAVIGVNRMGAICRDDVAVTDRPAQMRMEKKRPSLHSTRPAESKHDMKEGMRVHLSNAPSVPFEKACETRFMKSGSTIPAHDTPTDKNPGKQTMQSASQARTIGAVHGSAPDLLIVKEYDAADVLVIRQGLLVRGVQKSFKALITRREVINPPGEHKLIAQAASLRRLRVCQLQRTTRGDETDP